MLSLWSALVCVCYELSVLVIAEYALSPVTNGYDQLPKPMMPKRRKKRKKRKRRKRKRKTVTSPLRLAHTHIPLSSTKPRKAIVQTASARSNPLLLRVVVPRAKADTSAPCVTALSALHASMRPHQV